MAVRGKCPQFCGLYLTKGPNIQYEYCGSVSCWKKECGIRMALKTTNYARVSQLPTDNTAAIMALEDSTKVSPVWIAIVRTYCEILDAIAREDITHVTFGTPKTRDSFLITLNTPNGSKAYVGGEDGIELAESFVVEQIA